MKIKNDKGKVLHLQKKIKLDKKNVVELEKEMILLFGSIKILLFLSIKILLFRSIKIMASSAEILGGSFFFLTGKHNLEIFQERVKQCIVPLS